MHAANDHSAAEETLLDDLLCARRYRIGRVIAEGTTGHVFAARRLSDAQPVVLKVGSMASQMARTSLRAEAKALALLDDPNIVRCHEHLEGIDVAVLVVDHLEGTDLGTRMRAAPVARAEAMRWLGELASALDHVHAAGLVHRDLKPANVMIVPDEEGLERAVLIDFGLASPRASRNARSRFLCGTPAYMAPEQAVGDETLVGPAADRYALAALGLELLTGQRPYPNASIPELLRMVIEARPRAASALGDFGPFVDAVFARGLAREPRARFTSAWAFVDRLERALSCERSRSSGAASLRAQAA